MVSRKAAQTFGAALALCAAIAASPVHAQFAQQGNKFTASDLDDTNAPPELGSSMAISADGNTLVAGAPGDADPGNGNSANGAAVVFVRSGGVWTQQGPKLTAGANAVLGAGVAMSADGNTVAIGGPADNGFRGAVWVFTRSGSTWTQQGGKLAPSDGAGFSSSMGASVGISADGNTIVAGGASDDSDRGAAWVFVRNNGVWTQQGSKLIGTGEVNTGFVQHGRGVAISGDGNTIASGAPADDSGIGATWIFTRSNGVWTQQGSKLLANDSVPDSFGEVGQGNAVALSTDGNTLIASGQFDNNGLGAVWIYTRSGGVWTQQGTKLVGSGSSANGFGTVFQGTAVALSNDGNIAAIGALADGSGTNITGATWVFTRSGINWSQLGNKLVGTGGVYTHNNSGGDDEILQGSAVALSAAGGTLVISGREDGGNGDGSIWSFTQPALAVTPVATIASSGNSGGPFSPSSFPYTLSASGGDVTYSITAVPSWLDASSTSGTVLDGQQTVITFTVNASANSLGSGSHTGTINFINVDNNVGTTTRAAILAIDAPTLTVTPASDIAASGNVGGPFSPDSFNYTLTALHSNVDYTIGGIPVWLTASSTAGTVSTASPTTITFTINDSAAALAQGAYGPSTITITNTSSGLGNTSRQATLTVGAAPTTSIVSSVLPSSRTVQVGSPATAFATVMNTGSGSAVHCALAAVGGPAGAFRYQTSDAKTNQLTGTPNTPASIAAGNSQSFVFGITPNAAFGPAQVTISATCANADAPKVIPGVNTLLLAATTTPLPDIIALAASTDPGFVDLPGKNGIGAFAIATINAGAAGTITVSADTGLATLPVATTLCQTDSGGNCANPAFPGASSVTLPVAANATPTFSVFVFGSGTVADNPAANRIFVRFKDSGGITRGVTSVAVRTQ